MPALHLEIDAYLSMCANRMANHPFEIGFNIKKLDTDNSLREYPGMGSFPRNDEVFGDYHIDRSHIKYYPWIDRQHGRRFRISMPGYVLSPYHALRWVGFTHDEIASARYVCSQRDVDVYKLKTTRRTYEIGVSKFEQMLAQDVEGHDALDVRNRHGYDSLNICWKLPD